MTQAHYIPRADQNLVEIGARIAQDNPTAALRWVNGIEAVCELLAAQPSIGQRIKTKRLGDVRRHVAGNYLIYYKPTAGGVEILAVVHGHATKARSSDEQRRLTIKLLKPLQPPCHSCTASTNAITLSTGVC